MEILDELAQTVLTRETLLNTQHANKPPPPSMVNLQRGDIWRLWDSAGNLFGGMKGQVWMGLVRGSLELWLP